MVQDEIYTHKSAGTPPPPLILNKKLNDCFQSETDNLNASTLCYALCLDIVLLDHVYLLDEESSYKHGHVSVQLKYNPPSPLGICSKK